MPNHARSHSENLARVCYTCFNKVSKNGKRITEKLGQSLKKIDDSFVWKISDRPTVLCASCYLKINSETLSEIVDYSKIMIKEKRNLLKCICPICDVATSNVGKKVSDDVSAFMIPKKAAKSDVHKSSVKKICTLCNGEVRRGVKHDCTKRNKVSNTVNLTRGVEQQVAATLLYAEGERVGSSTILINKGRGANMQVAIKRKRDESVSTPAIPPSVLNEIQINCNMSTSSVKKMCKSLRTVNKNIVEPNAILKLHANSHDLDGFFTTAILTSVSVSKYSENGYPFVYCHDLPGLVSYLVDKRGISDDFHIKIGVDSGQRSLKVSLQFLLNYLCSLNICVTDLSLTFVNNRRK